MKTGIEDITPTRRDMLKQLGLGAGALMIGGTTFSGSAAAKSADPHFSPTDSSAVFNEDGSITVRYQISGLGNKHVGKQFNVNALALGELYYTCTSPGAGARVNPYTVRDSKSGTSDTSRPKKGTLEGIPSRLDSTSSPTIA